MLDFMRVIASRPKKPDATKLAELMTPWGERIAAGEKPEHVHPHPQFERSNWQLLDGLWDYAIVRPQGVTEARVAWKTATPPARYEGQIKVPFSPEAPLSGVNRQVGPDELLWYRRELSVVVAAPPSAYDPAAVSRAGVPDWFGARMVGGRGPLGWFGGARRPRSEALGGYASALGSALFAPSGSRVLLHFEAVDYACACYINGQLVGRHQGGYLPFVYDITDFLPVGMACEKPAELAVCVWDPSDAGTQPRGKQRLARGGIWYTAQSGIWQSVWLEIVPECHVASLMVDARADEARLVLRAQVNGVDEHGVPVVARLYDGDEVVATATKALSCSGEVQMSLRVRSLHRWSPDDPHLYSIKVLCGEDEISSYCAFRSVGVERGEDGVSRLCVNHEPVFVRGLLDQGYWPDGLMTAPSDEALAFDIQAAKDMGFNLLRKHIKLECDRWYWHCDRLGMLVMQDMVSGGGTYNPWHTSYKPTLFMASWGRKEDCSPRALQDLAANDRAYRREWTETCADAVSWLGMHPCVVAWCLFNEGWGQFDARAAVDLVRNLDSTRPIDATSGWYDQRCGDFLSVHNYFRPLRVQRDKVHPPRAFLISEFGGLSCSVAGHRSLEDSYGYDQLDDPAAFVAGVRRVLAQVDALEDRGLAGFVYTQLSDVEGETNGLLTYDRRVNKLLGTTMADVGPAAGELGGSDVAAAPAAGEPVVSDVAAEPAAGPEGLLATHDTPTAGRC